MPSDEGSAPRWLDDGMRLNDPMRYRLDGSWVRVGPEGEVVLAGSPYRVFRLTNAGAVVAERIEAGDDVRPSRLVDRLVDGGAIHPQPLAASTVGRGDVTIVTPQLGGVVQDHRRVTIDDGSEPPLVDATARLPVNRGPAAARNAGRRHATTEFVAFVDADVDLPIDGEGDDSPRAAAWWDPLLAHFDDAGVGLVAPRVLGDDGSSLDLGIEPARIRAGTRVSYVPAATMIVRATAFDAVGGFDETLRFGEDVDFVWRLDQAGWRCRYEPQSTVSHRPRPTVVGRLRQQVGYGSSSAPLALRHPNALAPFRSNGWTAGVWFLAATGHIGAALALAGGSAAALVPKLPGVPAKLSLRLAGTGHLLAGEQLARAVRRAWWPPVLAACLVSRRARLVALASILASPRALVIDIAFGTGLWSSVLRHRTWRPLIPQIAAWPPRPIPTGNKSQH